MSIKVDYASLQSTAGQLKGGQEEMTSQLIRLRAMVDDLVASGFVTDQASGQFQQSYQQWNSGTMNTLAGLQGMSSFLDTAIQRHQELDSSLRSQAAGA